MAIYRFNPGGINYPVTVVLIVTNVALALVDGFFDGKLSLQFGARGIDVWHGQWWRLLTCGFMHANTIHIAFNAYSLWSLGRIVEPLFGRQRFLAIYFTGLLGGAGLGLALYDGHDLMLGASGAVFALFGALLGHLYAKVGSWREVANVPYGMHLLIVLGFNAYMSWKVPQISLLGHLGGFLPGLYLGYFYTIRAMRDDSIYDRLGVAMMCCLVVSATIYAALPFNRASFVAIRAMLAYEDGKFERGDALLQEARSRKSDGPAWIMLTDHLRAWRASASDSPEKRSMAKLRAPLLTPFASTPGSAFLELTPELEALEKSQAATRDSAKP